MKLLFHTYSLKLKHTFRISREAHDEQPSLIVELQDEEYSGFGEATSNPYYNMSVEGMMNDLEGLRDLIENSAALNPEDFWALMHQHLSQNMFALCALDMAFNDLYSKKQHKKLYELWGYDISKNPLTNFTIGLDSIETMQLKMKEVPWPIYKIKLGSNQDIDIVKALRAQSKSIFRIDANCGWSVEQTIENSKELKRLGVEFIEQPIPANDWSGQFEVFKNSELPIIADESCQVESDVAKCYGFFDGVNVKLTKCGGLTPAKRMLAHARKLGLKTMVGCMTESSIGISAIAHLLPLLDYVDMDGALLLKEDIADGVTIDYGKVTYAKKPGTGAKLKFT